MSIEAELRAEFDREERREIVVISVLPYLLLAASTVVTLLQPVWGEPVPGPLVLGLALLTALWLVWFDVVQARGRRNGPSTVLYYAGLTVLAGSLTAIAPWYGIFAFVGYVHAFLFLHGRWRYLGVTVTAMIAAVSYVGGIAEIDGNGWWEWAALFGITLVLASSFFHFAELGYRRNDQQQRALAELHEANVKLAAALEENAGLQAQLLVQAREAGVLDERQRMAREIHDTLAQSLAGILTQLQAAEQTTDEPSTLNRHMTNAMNLARESLTEARRTVHAVGPELLADARLADAISDVTRRWSEANDIDAMLTTTGDPRPMHADVEVTLLRAAQEALANVAKHANAGRVGLTLSYMEDLVTLDVRDDGRGFDPDARPAGGSASGGFGLAGMRQRVQRLAGRLDIESEPGGGTAISASVPAIPAGCGS
ncbi:MULTISPECIES: sensor histidine kinase [Actinoalloteichus]|uniref:Oxygen sensor histidine kinase NreB n=1 Tax=Actinoalloteichus fjordicus TaxID=1612552 RepID=A0AAC9LGD0_9PSEU|nr:MULTISPECIES: sensor histidine kinase [Actinoalloteichus]APU16871.1 signal transduction histidine kinase [Actinoalloteichus fjordicus]APU22951.1 signal transduction histidine kinase [Actinoalloteichus sp. GBA129-24]